MTPSYSQKDSGFSYTRVAYKPSYEKAHDETPGKNDYSYDVASSAMAGRDFGAKKRPTSSSGREPEPFFKPQPSYTVDRADQEQEQHTRTFLHRTDNSEHGRDSAEKPRARLDQMDNQRQQISSSNDYGH